MILLKFSYRTRGTCSRQINFEIEDRKLRNVEYISGCNGNLQGIAKLVEGMDIDEVRERLRGISCGGKPTSCPDQLAQALDEAEKKLNSEHA